MKRMKPAHIGLAVAAALALVNGAEAQTADALLNKLVQKGVLTQSEADDLKKETDLGFAKAYQVKSGIPSWVTSFKIGGDLRGRMEGFYADPKDDFGNDLMKDRTRFRYRVRLGAVATLFDNLEAGFRITSSEPRENFGGDPISGNTTMQDNASYKFVFIDRAYGRWAPKWGDFSAATTIGKMENPFIVSGMVFDPDYAPEGAAQQFAFKLDDISTIRLNLGGFVLDELSNDSDDPFLLGAQLRWDANITPALQLTAGVAGFLIDNEETLFEGPNQVPDIQKGNTRTAGRLTAQFNPIVADVGITFNVPNVPISNGPLPIRLAGEYMNNLAQGTMNQAFSGGVTIGRAAKKGTWEVAYLYKYIAANAWYEEFLDSDFGAFRPTLAAGVQGGSYSAGSNVKGHILRAAYALSDGMSLGVTYFLTEIINSGTTGVRDLETGRLEIDALWRF